MRDDAKLVKWTMAYRRMSLKLLDWCDTILQTPYSHWAWALSVWAVMTLFLITYALISSPFILYFNIYRQFFLEKIRREQFGPFRTPTIGETTVRIYQGWRYSTPRGYSVPPEKVNWQKDGF